MAGLDALLLAVPEVGIQQVGVMAHEDLSHPRVTEQEGGEGLRKTSRGATGHQTSPDISSSSLRGAGARRKWQSVRYSISS